MKTYIAIVSIVLAWTIQLGLAKQNTYTSYVKLDTEQETECDGSCVALRIGLALGLGVLFLMCVSIPVVCCCVYKLRQRRFRFSKKKRGRDERYELVNQNSEWVGDLSSDTPEYASDGIDD